MVKLNVVVAVSILAMLLASSQGHCEAGYAAQFQSCVNSKIDVVRTQCMVAHQSDCQISSGSDVALGSCGLVQQCVLNSQGKVTKDCQSKLNDLYGQNDAVPSQAPSTNPDDGKLRDPNPACAPGMPSIPGIDCSTATPQAQTKPSPTDATKPQRAKTATSGTTGGKSITTQAANQSAQNTTPQPPQNADPEAGSDVSLCESAFTSAQSCCNNPTSCLSGSDQARYLQSQSAATPTSASGGISSSCSQMQAAGQNSRDSNGLLAGACSGKQSECASACSTLIGKYQTLLANCNGCESGELYQSALSALQSKSQQCGQLSARVQDLTGQSLASSNGQISGADCLQAASAQSTPTSSGFGDSSGTANSTACEQDPRSAQCQQLCARTPSAAGCERGAAAAQTSENGTVQFTASNKNAASFNLANASVLSGTGEPALEIGKPGEPPQVKPIANNTGGSPLGGGSATQATLGGVKRGVASSPGDSGLSTDVDQGLRSGGYVSPDLSNGFYVDEGGGHVSLHPPPGTLDGLSGWLGFDLKPYLPRTVASLLGHSSFKDANSRFKATSALKARLDGYYPCIGFRYPKGCDLSMQVPLLSISQASEIDRKDEAAHPANWSLVILIVVSIFGLLFILWSERAHIFSLVKSVGHALQGITEHNPPEEALLSEPIPILPERRKASTAVPSDGERRKANSATSPKKSEVDIETVIRKRKSGR